MSRKAAVESFQTKITRNDRFAQMSHQEKIIEQKKKEIQAKMEQKQKSMSAAAAADSNKSNSTTTATTTTVNKQEKPGFVYDAIVVIKTVVLMLLCGVLVQ